MSSDNASLTMPRRLFDNTGEGPLKILGSDESLFYNGHGDDRFCAGWSSDPYTWIQAPRVTVREVAMLQLMSDLTEKPDWEVHIFDDNIVAEWEKETLGRPLASKASWDWCIAELRDKAKTYIEDGHLLLLDVGACIYKSDKTVPTTLQHELKQVAATLSADVGIIANSLVPQHLIDPSMYMLSFDSSVILTQGGRVDLNDVFTRHGEAERAPRDRNVVNFAVKDQWLPCEVSFVEKESASDDVTVQITSYINNLHPVRYKGMYEVFERLISRVIEPWNRVLLKDICGTAETGMQAFGRVPMRIRTFGAEFDPPAPKDLYAELLSMQNVQAGSDSDTSLAQDDGPSTATEVPDQSKPSEALLARIEQFLSLPEDGLATTPPSDWQDNLMNSIVEKSRKVCRLQHPEPGTAFSFEDWKAGRTGKSIVPPVEHQWDGRPYRWIPEGDHPFYTVQLQDSFKEKGLQMVIDMCSVELTPDQRWSESGPWQTDGRYTDCIVATALYFFDVENIDRAALSFRHVTALDEVFYPQDFSEYGILVELLGLQNRYEELDNPPTPASFTEIHAPAHQTLGTVAVGDGRLIAWPNGIQYYMPLMGLADPSRAGHCRYIKLSLVEPNIRLCSTRNIFPQQADWWAEHLREILHLPLPLELQIQIENMTLAEQKGVMMSETAKEMKRHREKELAERARQYAIYPKNIMVFEEQDSESGWG